MYQKLLAAIRPTIQTNSTTAKIGAWTGVAGLLIFAFFSLLSIAGANIGLALMLLGMIISPAAWRRLSHEPLFWISLLTIAYIAFLGYRTALAFPEYHKTVVSQSKDWALLFIFFIPAWWISREKGRLLLTLSLMLIGFSLGILSSLDGATVSQILNGARLGLHFGKPIIFGFICAVAILALTTLTFYLLSPRAQLRTANKALFVGLTVISILFFIQGLIVSQSRGVWLSILIALPTALILIRRDRHPSAATSKATPILLAAVALIILAALSANWDTITKRVFVEQQELSIVVSKGLEEAPLGSSTYRLHLWRFGIERWLERPLMGWGPGTTYGLIDAENSIALKNPDGSSFDHLHNAYLEVLFQLGLIGLILIAVTTFLVISICVSQYKAGRISKYLFAFLLSNFVLILVYSLTDFRHLHWNWRFYWMILSGIVFSLALSPPNASSQSEADKA